MKEEKVTEDQLGTSTMLFQSDQNYCFCFSTFSWVCFVFCLKHVHQMPAEVIDVFQTLPETLDQLSGRPSSRTNIILENVAKELQPPLTRITIQIPHPPSTLDLVMHGFFLFPGMKMKF